MKNLVLGSNQHSFIERVMTFFNQGRSKTLKSNDLQWLEHRIFVEQAPEPNDIDWENIHITTKEKIKV